MALRTLNDLFGLPSQSQVEVPDVSVPNRPHVDPRYIFRPELMRDMLIFNNLGLRSCMLTGHKGTGKTSLAVQFHAVLNRSLVSATGNEKMTAEDLFGQFLPNEKGGLDWVDGPVTHAARTGTSVLINEFNAMPPGLQIALNDIAHNGERVPVPARNEMIDPPPGFRIFCTINPKGDNDFLYQARNLIDGALMERFFWIQVGYAGKDEERQVVLRAFQEMHPDMDEDAFGHIADMMVSVAERVRESAQAGTASSIPEMISTRVLRNWAVYWTQYEKRGGVHAALQRALTYGLRPEVAKAIHGIVAAEFGMPSPYALI
jgi:cobaltochelatase CobS